LKIYYLANFRGLGKQKNNGVEVKNSVNGFKVRIYDGSSRSSKGRGVKKNSSATSTDLGPAVDHQGKRGTREVPKGSPQDVNERCSFEGIRKGSQEPQGRGGRETGSRKTYIGGSLRSGPAFD